MSKQSLLLVDGDTRSLRVLEVSLRKAGFTVTTSESVRDALDKLEVHQPDLIVSETTFADGDGFELRRRVRATPDWGDIPFIFLTAEQAIENKIRGLELGVDDYLTKPIYIKEIITRINILLQKRQRARFEERRDGRTRFAGRVADMPVVDVIQTIEISRKSGVIQFLGERNKQATIYFRDGRVIDAEAGSLQGEDAVYRLLTWSDGEFEVVFRTVRRREVIQTSSQGLLMEGMRRLDEWSRILEQVPPLSHRFEVDAGELATRLGEVPDDNNRILRLIDGKRTLLEVIDASDVGDLECLQAIARLYFEEILIDLDWASGEKKRDTGRHGIIGLPPEGESPTPIEDAASGPVTQQQMRRLEEESGPRPMPDRPSEPVLLEGRTPTPEPLASHGVVSGPIVGAPQPEDTATTDRMSAVAEPPADGAQPTDSADVIAEEDAPLTPLVGSFRPSSLRLIDEAVAAAQLIEPSLFAGMDDLEDQPMETMAPPPSISAQFAKINPATLAEQAKAPNFSSGGSAPAIQIPERVTDRLPATRPADLPAGFSSAVTDRIPAQQPPIPDLPRIAKGATPGRGTPVAASTIAATPKLGMPAIAPTPRVGLPAVTPDPAVPTEIASDEPSAPASGRTPTKPAVARAPSPVTTVGGPVGRDDSGLRMIGSLGRDRAEASGELRLSAVMRAETAPPETQRELVTILPRRITREIPIQQPPGDDGVVKEALGTAQTGPMPAPHIGSPATAGTAPVETEAAAAVEPPVPAPPVLPAERELDSARNRARAAARDASGTMVMPRRTPSKGTLAMIGLAVALAALAIAMKLREHPATQPPADAAPSTSLPPPAPPNLGVPPPAPPPDAAPPIDAAVAAIAHDAAPVDARAPTAGSSAPAPTDPQAEAKALYTQAYNAVEEHDDAKALALAQASLKLRRTARTYLLEATALQHLGRIDEAVDAIDAAIDIYKRNGSDNAPAWEQKGRVLWGAGRKDDARAAFAHYLELEPNSPHAAAIRKLTGE